jgi:DNA mismatch repair protein MutS2
MLVGCRVEEALELLDRFLDAAHLSGHEEVRIVHGHGTGRLREAVRRYLRESVHVQTQRPGRAAEGGDGATVVRLR